MSTIFGIRQNEYSMLKTDSAHYLPAVQELQVSSTTKGRVATAGNGCR